MVMVILMAEDSRHGIAEALLRHAELRMFRLCEMKGVSRFQKHDDEYAPLSLSIEIENLLAIPARMLFKKKRSSPWQRGFSRDSKFKERPPRRRRSFCRRIFVPVHA